MSLADGLMAICSGTFLYEYSVLHVIKDALILAHHPAIYKASPNLWIKIIKNYMA